MTTRFIFSSYRTKVGRTYSHTIVLFISVLSLLLVAEAGHWEVTATG